MFTLWSCNIASFIHIVEILISERYSNLQKKQGVNIRKWMLTSLPILVYLFVCFKFVDIPNSSSLRNYSNFKCFAMSKLFWKSKVFFRIWEFKRNRKLLRFRGWKDFLLFQIFTNIGIFTEYWKYFEILDIFNFPSWLSCYFSKITFA